MVGVHNAAPSAINITVLAGSLNNAKAFSQHFQNFTAQVPDYLLPLALAAWDAVSIARQLICRAWLEARLA